MIEDRVQGGHLEKIFSYNFMDISIYSTGMDKKPCGLGGGFLCMNQETIQNKLYDYLELTIQNYPQEHFYDRFIFLIKKIPTYFLYNSKILIRIILMIFEYFDFDLHLFSSKYRKINPGFSHDDYNKNPSNGTLKSIEMSFKNYKNIEELYIQKSTHFYKLLNTNTRETMIPLVNNKYTLTPYNTIIVKDRDKIIKYFNKNRIPIIENPTYKMFNFVYKDSEKYQKFNDSIVYIPSLPIMNDSEIIYLATLINDYCKDNELH